VLIACPAWSSERVCPPITIKRQVDSWRAARRVGGWASRTSSCESIESRVREGPPHRIRSSTSDRIVVNRVVFILEIHSLDVVDLHERRYDLSVRVRYRAGWTRRYPSWWSRPWC